jgi:tetratricopeptide (TPR) repeat protein
LPVSCYGCGAAVRVDGELCPACRTERVPIDVDADELFPDRSEAEVTMITTIPYELRPAYTGREPALETLMSSFEKARDQSERAFVALIGEPGMGKSRTIKEFARRLKKKDPDARFLIGAADPSGTPHAAFVQLLSARFGVVAGDGAEDTREKIIAGISEVLPADRVTEVAHLIAHLLRVPFEDSPVVTPLLETPQQLETRTFIAVRRFLAADAEAGAMVLCFENLEHCGPETINLLHYLAAGLASAPIVILGTASSSLFERHPTFGGGEGRLVRIDIGPLSAEEAKQLLRELCRPLDFVPERLVEHAQSLAGSPRALFELIRLLLESDVIVRSGSLSWRIDEARLNTIMLPKTYEAVVEARLAVMDDNERDLIERAATVGEIFWLDAVVALVRVSALETDDPDGPTLSEIAAAGDHTRVSVAQALSKLVEREWIVEVPESSVPGEREYRFAYGHLWDHVYDGIQEDKRRAYHTMVARWLELRPEGRGPLAQEDVAEHLEQAGETVAAAARYRRAAQAARGKFLNDRAIRLYARALTCLAEHDLAARIHLWHDLGSVYELKGDFEAALGAFERMLRLAWVAASRSKAAVAFNKMGRVWRRKGDMKLALEYLQRGAELFEQAGDARGIAGSHDDIGRVMYLTGNYDAAFEHVTKGLARRGKGGDKRSIAQSLSNLGNIQKDRGQFQEAENCHQEALELRRQIGDRAGVIGSYNNLAVMAFERGDFAEARRGWQEALSEAEEIGALPLQALSLSNLGELALLEGHHDEARRRLNEALELAEEIDDARMIVEATRNLAQLEKESGHTERARELATHAHEVAAGAGLRDNEGRALLTLAAVWSANLFDADETVQDTLDQASAPKAEQYFQRGVEMLREIGNESELARGLEQYGRYKIERGEVGAGKGLLREALVIFSRLGMPRSAEVEKILQAV